ncbi:DUF599 domain-containing protein [Noviherbaspirillum galbum]|uniref:DUF599 domain-containing protein n=1 Tax=Noviherbaspirillum galbum TaxID=2709383 RepID=A0A6B3SQF2_9BURK|nr:DUF599 domain-containing protein [Noviherbaspirillum galbum]NEX62983.1 DUF599 domain-containing protein [Noviherbaspirillum galbum]
MSRDALALLASALMVAAYAVRAFASLRRDSAATVQGISRHARLLWVKNVMHDKGKDVMAVQTLRNYVMAATFKASTAAILIMGTLTLSVQAGRFGLNTGLRLHDLPDPWWTAKIAGLLAMLTLAFFSFAMVIRNLNHVVFMIGLRVEDATGVLAPERIAYRLNQAGNLYTLGMRAIFMTVPMVFWLLGPGFLLAATAAVIAVFHLLDKPLAPDLISNARD